MQPDLIGYVLAVDDEAARAETSEAVRSNPALQAECDGLRRVFGILEQLREDGPAPAGLAQRTVARLAAAHVVHPSDGPTHVPSKLIRSRWDVALALGILIVVSGLSLPALSRVHGAYQASACRNNLRELYGSLESYAAAHGGGYPNVAESRRGNRAGDFVGELDDGGAPVRAAALSCPAVRVAGGSNVDFAYNLGYRGANGRVMGVRHDTPEADGKYPVVADRPLAAWVPRPSRGNHASGANVLYLDGHVGFATAPTVGLAGEHIFINDAGRVAAGHHRGDAVLGSPDDRP